MNDELMEKIDQICRDLGGYFVAMPGDFHFVCPDEDGGYSRISLDDALTLEFEDVPSCQEDPKP